MNLIPEELELAQLRRRRLRAWAVSVIICIVLGAATAAWKYRSFASVDQASRAVAEEIDAIEKQQQHVASAENLLQRYQGQIALQRKLTRYPAVVEVTACLARSTPDMLFLRQFECAQPKENSAHPQTVSPLPKAAQMFNLKVPNLPDTSDGTDTAALNDPDDLQPYALFQLKLLGSAANYHTVADYLEALKKQPVFRQVDLKKTARDPALTGAVEFEIDCVLNRIPGFTGVDHASLPQTTSF